MPAVLLQIKPPDIPPIDQQCPALELMEAGNQPGDTALPRPRMPDQGQCLSLAYIQREVWKHNLTVDVAEPQVMKLDVPLHLCDRLVSGLHNAGLGIDQREHALGCGEPILELAPERGNARHRPPEEADGLHEEIPITRRDTGACGQPASVEEEGTDKARRHPQDGKDGVERHVPLETDAIGSLVVVTETVVDGVLLAECLRHHDPADGFLDLGVDDGIDAPGLARDPAGEPSEAEGNQDRQGSDADEHNSQPQVDGGKPDRQDRHQQDLADQVQDQGDDVGEVLCVRGDTANDLA